MNYGFAGTPPFAADIVTALIDAGYVPQFIITQPDRPAKRGQQLAAPPVKQVAMDKQIPYLQPDRIDDTLIDRLKAYQPQWILVIAYGRLLPDVLLDTPSEGCINIHTSLLPRWRGQPPSLERLNMAMI